MGFHITHVCLESQPDGPTHRPQIVALNQLALTSTCGVCVCLFMCVCLAGGLYNMAAQCTDPYQPNVATRRLRTGGRYLLVTGLS